MTVRDSYVALRGGEDLVSPGVALRPERLLRGLNYEIVSTAVGYRRMDGYERFDGQPAPSEGTTPTEITNRRAAITAVPGTGDILGITEFNDTIFAFRNATGGATADIYKSSGAGWVQVDIGNTIAFTVGTAAFVVGETLTGGTSGATATIQDVRVTSGTFGTSDAAGVITISAVTSGPFQAETGTSASGSATLSGAETAQTLAPDGKYEFIKANFYGTASFERVYGCNGEDNAFQFDGTAFIKIVTGMTTDQPEHIEYHKNHLMLSFPGGSLQNSDLGDPLSWTGLRGAAEMGIGEEITELKTLRGGTLAIFGEDVTSILSGSVAADFVINEHSKNVGAKSHTVQRINDTYFISNEGLTSLGATDQFGDFAHAYISRDVQPLVDALAVSATDSIEVRSKSQYRLFAPLTTETDVLVACFGGKNNSGFTRFKLPIVTTATERVEVANTERLFMGDDAGFVFEIDKGTSFDGAEIEAVLAFPYNHFNMPRYRKRYRKLIMEMSSPGTSSIQFSLDFDYGADTIPVDGVYNGQNTPLGGYWNVADWNEFVWSGRFSSEVSANISGIGVNVGLVIYSSSATDAPHTVQSISWHYSQLRLER